MNILYIGNSYTFFNNLPDTVAALARTPNSEPWSSGRFLRGGAGLRTHFCDNLGQSSGRGRYCTDLDPSRTGQLDALLSQGPWDAVVMQGQSMDTVLTPDDFFAYGKVLADRIRAAGSERILLYQTWARQHFPEMQAVITAAYARLATAIGADVFQAGEAWKLAFSEREGLVLHTEDRSHPNDRGSYLAACTLYQRLTGRSPVGLPWELEDIRWDGHAGPCYHLDAETARFLQTVAARIP